MISPKEIEAQCLGWWKQVLTDVALDRPWTLREIRRIRKVSSKDILNRLSAYRDSIDDLKRQAKGTKPLGYRLDITTRQFEKIGLQPVPSGIFIDTLDDYLYVTRKKAEFSTFVSNLKLIRREMPQLLNWVVLNPLKLIEHESWPETLSVCHYFLRVPRPKLYIRQLPIDVHTKYVIENKAIITSLLNYLIPDHINSDETDFEKRFNLLSRDQLIRIRFLDPLMSPLPGITDMSFTESELSKYPFAIDNVLIAENLMNFLTLPEVAKTIAIWSGGGFNVSYLRKIEWLASKKFYYWGDIDAQGFQILSQCRRYFPNTVSVMMDRETLESFPGASGTPAKELPLNNLSEEELLIYRKVVRGNIRLEQEKITHRFAVDAINRSISAVPTSPLPAP